MMADPRLSLATEGSDAPSSPGGGSPGCPVGDEDIYKGRDSIHLLPSWKRTGATQGRRRGEIQVWGLNISEGRALWRDLGHQARDFTLGEAAAGGASAPAPCRLLPTVLSNSLKQNVHTDPAPWRRKNTKDAHTVPCATHSMSHTFTHSRPGSSLLGLWSARK